MQKIITILTIVTLMLITASRAEATTIFSDGFESGNFDAWTGTYITSGQSLTVQDTIKHHGTYAAKAETVAGAGWKNAYAYQRFSSASTVYGRAYFYIDSYTGGETRGFINFANWDYSRTSAGIAIDENRYLYLQYFYGSGDVAYDTSATALALDTWYSLELKVVISATVGEVRVYLNGTEVEDLAQTGLNNSWCLGTTQVAGGLINSNSSVAIVYYDCVVVSDSYIGPEIGARLQDCLVQDALIQSP